LGPSDVDGEPIAPTQPTARLQSVAAKSERGLRPLN
jgi:hypothetical protein